MTKLLEKYLNPLRAPEGEGGADAAAADAAAAPKDSASILYGDDDGDADADADKGDADPDKPAGDGDGAADDWKEFVPDPAKSDEENAAAKAEHDKTKPDDKSDDPAAKIPEDGKYALTMPEGVEVDQELLDALGPKFAAKKMTNGEAQELADEFIKVQTQRAEKQAEAWAKTVSTDWPAQARADKEIGGANWDASAANAVRAVKTLGTPALKEYLDASGGGNHPELIRFMAKVGSMIKEDDPAKGNAPGKATRDRAEVLYPDDKPKGN